MDPQANNKELPSGGNDCPSGQAGPPLVQVKILRRPKPNETSYNSNRRSTGNSYNNNDQTIAPGANSASGVVNPMTSTARLTSERARISSKYEEEWPSIGDAATNGLGSQRQSQQARTGVTGRAHWNPSPQVDPVAPSSDISNREPRAIIARPSTSTNGQESDQLNSQPSNRTNIEYRPHQQQQQQQHCKAPLKTYQERADEYAKARLRILGSACSEDDKIDDTIVTPSGR